MARIWAHEGRILLAAPYDSGRGPQQAKKVPGARWDRENKVWNYPLSIDTCRAMRRVYGKVLEVHPDLFAWAEHEVSKERALASLASSGDADLHNLHEFSPSLAQALRPYQKAGVAYIREASKDGGVLLADEPRTGKTLQSIAGVLELGRPEGIHLVVCPRLSIHNVWEREIDKWDAGLPYACSGSRKQRLDTIELALSAEAGNHTWVIVNPEMLRYKETCLDPDCKGVGKTGHRKEHGVDVHMEYPELFRVKWDSVIVDESHKVFGSYRPQHGSQSANGLGRLNIKGLRLAVTGTPFGRGGRVAGMFGTMHWLRPKVYTSFWKWAGQYLEVNKNQWGYMEVGGLRAGQSETDMFKSIGNIILRRTRKEVMPWLGDKVYEDVYCPMTPAQAKAYKQMEDGGSFQGLTADGTLAELTRLKQFANTRHEVTNGEYLPTKDSGKFEAMLDRLDSHGVFDGEASALLFTQYEKFARVIAEVLEEQDGAKVCMITGPTKEQDRVRAISDFQSGRKNLCVLTTQTGGVSITLDAASVVIMMDELFNPEENVQAEDRGITTSRDGNTDSLAIYYIRSEDTIESWVRDHVVDKALAQHAVLDGRRGLEYARRLMSDG